MTDPTNPSSEIPPSSPPPPIAPPITPDYSAPAENKGLFAIPPAPPFSPDKDARLWGMLAHLTGLAGLIGLPLGNILGPLIIWMIKKGEMPFVDDQGKEALNFQISAILAAIILTPTICIGVGLIVLPAIGVIDLVFIIIASMKANSGETYRYPYSIRFIK